MDDVAEQYRRLSARMTGLIAAVPDDAWSRLSPCEGWTARDLVGHLIDVHGRFQSLAGRDLVEHAPVEDDPLGAWEAVRDQMQADLADPARRDQEFEGRLGRSTFWKDVDGVLRF